MTSAKKALSQLLESLFTSGELRRWIAHDSELCVVANVLPGERASQVELVAALIERASHRGLIGPPLFASLREERPQKSAEIEAVEALWSANLGAIEEPWSPSPRLRRYLEWLQALRWPCPASAVGIDRQLRGRALYVPVHLAMRSLSAEMKAVQGPKLEDERTFSVDGLFHALGRAGRRHALLVGEPGSGKTMLLQHLAEVVGDRARQACEGYDGGPQTPRVRGLVAHTLPIVVRLHDWRRLVRGGGLRAFISEALLAASCTDTRAALDTAVIEEILEHGQLLLLLDSLDEISDPRDRAAFCGRLAEELEGLPSARVLLTCRRACLPAGAALKRLKGFAHLSLRPLSRPQADELIRLWFARVSAHGLLGADEADAHAAQLAAALDDPRFTVHRRAMYASPFIVTLLCTLHFRGRSLPASRVEVYDTWLRVLLTGSPGARRGADEPPLSVEQALALLRPLAYGVHRRGASAEGDQLGREIILAELEDSLEELGLDHLVTVDVLSWLHEGAGVLDESSPDRFGFFHLGVQEYLAASHLARLGAPALLELAQRSDEARWREVVVLAGGLSLPGTFDALVGALLDRLDLLDPASWGLLRELILGAECDPEPFLRFFTDAAAEDGPRVRAVLQLIEDRRLPRLLPAIELLVERFADDLDTRGLAAQYVARWSAQRDHGRPYDVAVVASADATDAAAELLRLLRLREGLRVWPDGDISPSLSELDSASLREAARSIVLVVRDLLPWDDRHALEWARLRTISRQRGFFTVLAPGAQRLEIDGPRQVLGKLDMRDGWEVDALADALRRSVRRSPGPVDARDGVLEEPRTGIRLRSVPGGVYTVGSDVVRGHFSPVHRVELDPFWIAETPVTNHQYRIFVRATKRREPDSWRDVRLADPQQPVVMVSWHDALAFCRWLRDNSQFAFDLPSEAQWEVAARGEDGRCYPWGNTMPTPQLAHYAKSRAGRPAVVAALPRGRGPYGALDQAGNVWEWCRDRWRADLSSTRAPPPAVNDLRRVLLTESSRAPRAIRGGSWHGRRESLLCASRLWCRSEERSLDDLGFRVAIMTGHRASQLR